MFNLLEKVNYYMSKGYSRLYARNKVAQDIILSQIAISSLKKNITIKGGVALFNITNDLRRATEDIDIDFIRYSLSEESINRFIDKLQNKKIGIIVKLIGSPILLKHQNYKGKRITVKICDCFGYSIKVKMDIGVQNDLNIYQEEFLFNFESLKRKLSLQINTKEQIFVEKLTSFLYHGISSTRYKDIFDMYYFVECTKLKDKLVKELIDKYILSNINNIKEVKDIYHELHIIFYNKRILDSLSKSKYNWINVEINTVISKILEYLLSLETVKA